MVGYATFNITGEPFDGLWQQIKGKTAAQLKAAEGDDNALFKLIRQHGMARELPLVIATLKAFSQGKVNVEDGRVLNRLGKPISGYNLTAEIEERLKS